MTTNLDIIKRGMKKLHVLPSGMEPTAPQAYDAMVTLQSIYCEVIGLGLLGKMYDVLATANLTALEWARVRVDGAGLTITLPTTITQQIFDSWPFLFSNFYRNCGPDYGWFYRWGFWNLPRPPFNLAPVVITGANSYTIGTTVYTDETYWIYMADQGVWVEVGSLGQQDSFPFAKSLEEGFAAMLAERLSDDYDQEISQTTQKLAAWCRQALSNKQDSVKPNNGSPLSYF